MRPTSIQRFEMLYWLWLVLTGITTAMGWSALLGSPDTQAVMAQMPWFPYALALILAALLIWLGLATARRASAVGRVIFTILALSSVALVARAMMTLGLPADAQNWLSALAAVVAAAAAVMLYRRDASAWFRTARPDGVA